MQFLNQLFSNYIAISAFWGWFLAQALKFVIVLWQIRRLQWERLIGSGGFPSSHTSLVVALSTATAYEHGPTSDLFVICLTFSLIVMYDASGVRREAGRQAQILNQLMEHFKTRNIPVHIEGGQMLKELLGHTPFEVFGGAILGYAVASIIYYNFL